MCFRKLFRESLRRSWLTEKLEELRTNPLNLAKIQEFWRDVLLKLYQIFARVLCSQAEIAFS